MAKFHRQLVADTQGDDNQNLNEVLVRIRNMGANLVDMTGWGIKDESSSNRYTFPIGFSLAPGRSRHRLLRVRR